MIITQFINSIFNSNTYIISNENERNCWLIDCGDPEALIKWVTNNHKNLVGIFITHGHYDHIYGLNKVVEAFPNCIVYTSMKGKDNLYSEKLNLSRYSGNSFVFNYDNLSVLKDHDTVNLSQDLLLEVMETPGHDWSCLTFNVENHLFTGDSFLPDYIFNIKFPRGDRAQRDKSVIRIKSKINEGARNIYPGHGEIKTSYYCS
jgi:hydroxyacylglutathione hydrolase